MIKIHTESVTTDVIPAKDNMVENKNMLSVVFYDINWDDPVNNDTLESILKDLLRTDYTWTDNLLSLICEENKKNLVESIADFDHDILPDSVSHIMNYDRPAWLEILEDMISNTTDPEISDILDTIPLDILSSYVRKKKIGNII